VSGAGVELERSPVEGLLVNAAGMKKLKLSVAQSGGGIVAAT
jgi:hypothetical protein